MTEKRHASLAPIAIALTGPLLHTSASAAIGQCSSATVLFGAQPYRPAGASG